jgi:hypothetical protein
MSLRDWIYDALAGADENSLTAPRELACEIAQSIKARVAKAGAHEAICEIIDSYRPTSRASDTYPIADEILLMLTAIGMETRRAETTGSAAKP